MLILSNVTEWKTTYIDQLLEVFGNYIDSVDYKENRLLLSYNPLMSIALSADILTQIGKAKKRYQDATNAMVESLLGLG